MIDRKTVDLVQSIAFALQQKCNTDEIEGSIIAAAILVGLEQLRETIAKTIDP